MAGERRLGTAYYDVEIRETVSAEIKQIEAEVKGATSRISKMKGEAEAGLRLHELERKHKRAKLLLKSLEGQKVTAVADADVKALETKILKARAMVEALDGMKAQVRITIDENAMRRNEGITRQFVRRIRDGENAVQAFGDSTRRAFQAVSNIGVIVGPFATSFGNFARAMTVGAPVMAVILTIATNLVAGFTALAGAIGSALVGALTLGVGALAAFSVGLAGVAAIAVPLIGDMNRLKKMFDQWREAQERYGDSSAEAANKLEKIREITGHVGEENLRALQSIHSLTNEFGRLTKEARPAFFNTFAEGIRTARSLMPTFAKGAVEGFQAVTRSIRGLMEALRTPEARQIIQSLMGTFADAIGPVVRGIGLLVGAIGRLGQIVGPYVVKAAQAFRDWARGIFEATGNTDSMNGKVATLMGHLKDLGRFLGGGFDLATAILGRGAKDGASLLRDWGEGMSDLADEIRKDPGMLKDFFREGKEQLQDIVGTIDNVVTAIDNISTAFNDAWDAASDFVGFFDDLFQGIEGIQEDLSEHLTIDLSGLFSAIEDAFRGFRNFIIDVVDEILGVVTTMMDGLAEVAGLGGPVTDALGIGKNDIARASDDINILRENLRGLKDDGKDAVESIKREVGGGDFLKGKDLKKTIKLAVSGDKEAQQQLASTVGLANRIPERKNTRISESGSGNVISKVGQVIARILGIPQRKDTRHNFFTDAASKIGSLLGLIAAIPRTVVTTHAFNRANNASPGSDAAQRRGGYNGLAYRPQQKGVEAAAARAVGQRVDRPMFLVGEERRPEYVLATNPAYRKRNIGLWAEAARELGIPGFAGGGRMYKPKMPRMPKPGPTAGSGTPGAYPDYEGYAGFTPNSSPGLLRRGEPRIIPGRDKKGLWRLKSGSPSAKRVQQLQTRQGWIEREISLKSRSIREPETFLKRIGGTDEFPLYEIDQGIVNSFVAQLEELKSLQTYLAQLVSEEVQALPEAIAELTWIRDAAKANLSPLRGEKRSLEARINAEQKKKNPSGSKVNDLQKQLRKVEKDIERQEKYRDDAKEDLSEFRPRQKDAAFEYRERMQDVADTQFEIDAVAGRASSEFDSTRGFGTTGGSATSDADTTRLQNELSIAYARIGELQAFGSSGDIGSGGYFNALAAGAGTNIGMTVGDRDSRDGTASVLNSAAYQGSAGSTSVMRNFALGGGGGGSWGALSLGGGGGTVVNQTINTLHPGDPQTLQAVGQAAASGFSYTSRTSSRVNAGL
jgi:archaellum component FlaC